MPLDQGMHGDSRCALMTTKGQSVYLGVLRETTNATTRARSWVGGGRTSPHLVREKTARAVPCVDDNLEPRQGEVVVVLAGDTLLDQIAQESGVKGQKGNLGRGDEKVRSLTGLVKAKHPQRVYRLITSLLDYC